MTRCLCLDLDGTIADSIPVLKDVHIKFLNLYNRKPYTNEFDEINGPSIPNFVAYLKEKHNLTDDVEKLIRIYRELIEVNYCHAPLVPHAKELIEMAHKHKWKIAIVTSNSCALANEWLDKNGLLKYVSTIIGFEQVKKTKPNPEPFILALQKTGASPKESLAIDDSPSGIAAAIAANIKTYAFCPSPLNAFEANDKATTIHSLLSVIPWIKKC